jgi:hypothetical protein
MGSGWNWLRVMSIGGFDIAVLKLLGLIPEGYVFSKMDLGK